MPVDYTTPSDDFPTLGNPVKSTATISESFENSAKTRSDPGSLPSKIMNAMSSFTPVRKLSDEEYLEVLLEKRDEVARRLIEIEDEELRLFDSEKR